jgi:hypothetical protein
MTALGEGLSIEFIDALRTQQRAATLLQAHGRNARWLHAGATIAGSQIEIFNTTEPSSTWMARSKPSSSGPIWVQQAQASKEAERQGAEGSAQSADQTEAPYQKQERDDQAWAQDPCGA